MNERHPPPQPAGTASNAPESSESSQNQLATIPRMLDTNSSLASISNTFQSNLLQFSLLSTNNTVTTSSGAPMQTQLLSANRSDIPTQDRCAFSATANSFPSPGIIGLTSTSNSGGLITGRAAPISSNLLTDNIHQREFEVAEFLARMRATTDSVTSNAGRMSHQVTQPPQLASNSNTFGSTINPNSISEQLRQVLQQQLDYCNLQRASLATQQPPPSTSQMRLPPSPSELINSNVLLAFAQLQQSSGSVNPTQHSAINAINPPAPSQSIATSTPLSFLNNAGAPILASDHSQQLLQLFALKHQLASGNSALLTSASQQQSVPSGLNLSPNTSPQVGQETRQNAQQQLGVIMSGQPARTIGPSRLLSPTKGQQPNKAGHLVLMPQGSTAPIPTGDDDIDAAPHRDPHQLQRQMQVNRLREQKRQEGTARLPYSSESCHTITKFLMDYNLSSDIEFSKKAIESLIKRLRDKREELDFFIQSVYHGIDAGQMPSECVTIPRTLDGRLQVAGRKGFPHVVYARIFRWPDLHKNEIKHLPQCKAAFDMKCDSVCVNPFHYQRIATPSHLDIEGIASSAIHASSSRHMSSSDELSSSSTSLTSKPMDNPPMVAPQLPTLPPLNSIINPVTAAAASSHMLYLQKLLEQYQQSNAANQEHAMQAQSSALCAETSSLALSKQWLADFSKTLAANAPQTTNCPTLTNCVITAAEPVSVENNAAQSISAQEQTEIRLQLSPGIAEKLSQLRHDTSPSAMYGDANEVERLLKTSNVIGERLPTAFLDNLSRLDGIEALLRHFCSTLRAELKAVSLEASDNEIAMEKEMQYTSQTEQLARFMQRFPLSVSALVRLLNESNSNSSTPSSEQHCKSPIGKRALEYSSLSEDNGETVSGREDNDEDTVEEKSEPTPVMTENLGERDVKPEGFKIDDAPPCKRRCRHVSEGTASSAAELVAMIEHVNTTNPHFPAIIDDLRRMLQADAQVSLDTNRVRLAPLMNLLGVCLEKGTSNAMTRLIKAIFANINAKKSIPLMDGFATDAPIFTIGYHEFSEQMGKQTHFFNPLVYCGALPLDSEHKEHLEVGTAKLSTNWNPLQTQQIYDCRRNIAYGIAMEVTDEGEVYLRCLSTRPVYVESHYLDRESMRVVGDTTHAIYQQAAIKVYDLWQSFQLMCFLVTRKLLSKRHGSLYSSRKLEADMNRLCKFRVSFGIDWGTDQFPTIQNTPCWLEVDMSRAKRLVDNLMSRPAIAYDFVFNTSGNTIRQLSDIPGFEGNV